MKLNDLLTGLVAVNRDVDVTGLKQDSRLIQPGDVFVAILPPRGEGHQHGLRFAQAAREKGAVAILFEGPLAEGIEVPADAIEVPGLSMHLDLLANRLYGNVTDAMEVVGVTGTNGKTSTTQLIAQAWSRLGETVGTIGTLGAGLHGKEVATGFTTPLVLETHALIADMHAQGASAVVMEVSSHALDQGRVDGIAFDIAVFSNLTRDHLDYHGTMEAYGDAKRRLFQWPSLTAAVINIDDAFGNTLVDTLADDVRAIRTSAEGAQGADIRAGDLRFNTDGIHFELFVGDEMHTVHSSLLGRFNVDNLLAVAGVLWAQNHDARDIAGTLGALQPIHGRMNKLGGGNHPLVVVDYAHTPDALEQALKTLRIHTDTKLICVFGCGGDRDTGKRPQMGGIAERLADFAIVTDDNPRTEDGDVIVQQILEGMQSPADAEVIRDRAQAIKRAIQMANAGDVVLIAGKGHEDYQEVNNVRHHFDDTEVAQAVLTYPFPDGDALKGGSP
ncbi:UDP-N-acetylmuramoyl-L-alanyl-D-glutamate--2,6-diaminopimelate ligase [Lysobacter sp. HDW10]|uniref:UDP-N-acetylmuramoyl-L-alanyl-D-glutamate--2, 6-diaminopimelate ligase n=1 Tax=Lysobacter sp. HDW10 TaxID=2714936 RepID=UPI001407B84E|nr:UDP-N-acetylmuramoyl-L-alanyl-D-glutamate--2,6-diaminopimelate ligase [Lysobacter sp. HDW10]QIK80369.1 UDP-N-acetylmuramoyl-L-alanyl-D-glutamate--2,6-diaminopimelate ligase [Lysobacter sp. HDW10]